ncbi:unnamed protein product [Parascedosporium putredinis]|uniref:Uncharacterized protein n=1 Tax=Parascedosporium putredinis TaxID=1442378 RepID=A0A9P1GWA6_9PEZI|nr:unnamed protein product [Parascedosporium putredinis]CAI7988238.1 unnamed protein product [Parascedosporium putredinis]
MSMFRAKKLDLGCFINTRIIRDHTKRKVFEQFEPESSPLRHSQHDPPPRVRAEAQLQLSTMHAYTRPSQIRNRCILGGKTRGILRDFKLTRYNFRRQALDGNLPGVKKATIDVVEALFLRRTAAVDPNCARALGGDRLRPKLYGHSCSRQGPTPSDPCFEQQDAADKREEDDDGANDDANLPRTHFVAPGSRKVRVGGHVDLAASAAGTAPDLVPGGSRAALVGTTERRENPVTDKVTPQSPFPTSGKHGRVSQPSVTARDRRRHPRQPKLELAQLRGKFVGRLPSPCPFWASLTTDRISTGRQGHFEILH